MAFMAISSDDAVADRASSSCTERFSTKRGAVLGLIGGVLFVGIVLFIAPKTSSEASARFLRAALPQETTVLDSVANVSTPEPRRLIIQSSSRRRPWNPWTRFVSFKGLRRGDRPLPIVISSTHDGTLKPRSIPDRVDATESSDGSLCVFASGCSFPKRGDCETKKKRDNHAGEIGKLVRQNLFKLTGRKAYLVENLLHRSKLDANREICEAAQDQPLAKRAWQFYMDKIIKSRQAVEEKFGKGLFIDFHGIKEKSEVQLGYGLSRRDLNHSEGNIDAFTNKSFLRSLAQGKSLEDLIRGPDAFGTRLSKAYPEVPSTPSQQIPVSNATDYFSGGYLSKQFGSRDGGTIDSIQVEISSDIRYSRTTPFDREVFAAALAGELLDWMRDSYGTDFSFLGGWTYLKRGWCSANLRKDLREHGTSIEECKALALADPDCGYQVYGNGHRCRCVRHGKTCDFKETATTTNTVYAYRGCQRRRRNGFCAPSRRRKMSEGAE